MAARKNASSKKSAKKPARKARAKHKTPGQYEEEIADLNERLKMSQYRYTTLASAVESERSLSKTVVTAYEELQRDLAHFVQQHNELVDLYNANLDQLADLQDKELVHKGKSEGMFIAYQHALETVTNNLATNMVTMLTVPPTAATQE